MLKFLLGGVDGSIGIHGKAFLFGRLAVHSRNVFCASHPISCPVAPAEKTTITLVINSRLTDLVLSQAVGPRASLQGWQLLGSVSCPPGELW